MTNLDIPDTISYNAIVCTLIIYGFCISGMHYAVLYAAGGIWTGYYFQRIVTKSKMGQVKYAMDFMERHKDNIPLKSMFSVHLATTNNMYQS